MQPTQALSSRSRVASTPVRPRCGRSGGTIFLATFLGAWLGLELMASSPPNAVSAIAALLAAGGVLFASGTWTSGGTPAELARALGLGRSNPRALLAATLVGAAVITTYVVGAELLGTELTVRADWPTVLVGVLLFHGLAEELVWRGYAFGHLRTRHSFWGAIAWSVPLLALTHVSIIAGNGVAIGTLAVLTAAVTCLPFAYLWERAGRSVWAPAILHGLQGTWQLFDRTYGSEFMFLILGASLTVPLAVFAFRRSFFEPRRT